MTLEYVKFAGKVSSTVKGKEKEPVSVVIAFIPLFVMVITNSHGPPGAHSFRPSLVSSRSLAMGFDVTNTSQVAGRTSWVEPGGISCFVIFALFVNVPVR